MEKAWPPLKECYQFKIGMMNNALLRYPWEEDGYAFDFESFHPPIPEEFTSLRRLFDSLKKNGFRSPSSPEDTRDCPFCLDPNSQDLNTLLKAPVWDMIPIPCPFHLLRHFWPFGGAPGLVTPQQLEDTKKYLKQVRNSRGYDVDCVPHSALVSPEFWNIALNDEVGRSIKDSIKCELDSTVIVDINLKTGKIYKLDEILKIVSASNRCLYLVTFTAKVQNDDSAASETFIATLNETNLPDVNPLMECFLKPDCDAPGPDHCPDFIIQPMSIKVSRLDMRPLAER